MALIYYAVYKPYNMLSQFTDPAGRKTLASLYDFPKDVYPVGRLDMDSEGLLILTNDKKLNDFLLNPKHITEITGRCSNRKKENSSGKCF